MHICLGSTTMPIALSPIPSKFMLHITHFGRTGQVGNIEEQRMGKGMRLYRIGDAWYFFTSNFCIMLSQELDEAQKRLRELEKKHQARDRELRRSTECQQRDILTGLLAEWQRSADVAGVKKPRSLSLGSHGLGGGGAGGSSLNSATETALVSLTANCWLLPAPHPHFCWSSVDQGVLWNEAKTAS